MHSLGQYLATLTDSRGLTRTLGDIELCRDAQGRPLCTAGNSAAVFRILHDGRIRTLRCYLRPRHHLRQIYGERLLEKELFLYDTPETGSWTDVVLGEWIEGETLQQTIRDAATAGDRKRLAALAVQFDRLAAAMVRDDSAHGDLKPENIIVDAAGILHPIDLDATFLPAFAGERSPELGTAAYQHPARTAHDFDERLDDYPAALISTALHALALDPSLHVRFGGRDGLLFDPRAIPDDAAYREARMLFCRRGRAVQYRIACLLASPTLRLPGLPELFAHAVEESGRDGAERRTAGTAAETRRDNGQPDTVRQRAGTRRTGLRNAGRPASGTHTTAQNDAVSCAAARHEPPSDGPTPELFVENGLWGYRTPQREAVPPLYDCGFDFTEGLAAVQLGPAWHYIDTAGRVVLSCPDCYAVKPFRNGRAQIVRAGRRTQIDRTGREFDF